MKKNNEILAILLAVISLFIFVSLLEFKSIYEPHILFSLFNSENMSHIQLPFTGILGASISAILIKYFLGYGSFMVCTIMFMYSYLIFTQKDYTNKKYVFLSLYQIGINSIYTKKEERLKELQKEYDLILRYYPETPFLDDLNKKMDNVNSELKKIQQRV